MSFSVAIMDNGMTIVLTVPPIWREIGVIYAESQMSMPVHIFYVTEREGVD
jgi:hypothetical protein